MALIGGVRGDRAVQILGPNGATTLVPGWHTSNPGVVLTPALMGGVRLETHYAITHIPTTRAFFPKVSMEVAWMVAEVVARVAPWHECQTMDEVMAMWRAMPREIKLWFHDGQSTWWAR